MRVAVVHETVYRYEDPANYSVQYLRLSPRSTSRQKVLWWKLDTPAPPRPWVDAYGNEAHVLVLDRPHSEIRVRARGEIDVNDATDAAEDVGPQGTDVFLRSTPLTTVDAALSSFVADVEPALTRDRAAGLDAMMGALRDRIDYRPGVTHAATAAADAFANKAGVCQDHAHVFVACCRALSVPARYVSGYLGSTRDEQLASHAWAEAWIDGHGWRGYDVANRTIPGGRHVRLAVGLDYLDACPVRGFRRGGSGESMAVEVHVGDLPRPNGGAKDNAPAAGSAQQHQRARRQQQQQQQQQQ